MTIMARLRDLEADAHTHEDDEHFTVVKEGNRTIKQVPRDTSVASAEGEGGGVVAQGDVFPVKVKSRQELQTYLVDVYTMWSQDLTLDVANRIYEDAIMKTPTLDDALAVDQIPVDSVFNCIAPPVTPETYDALTLYSVGDYVYYSSVLAAYDAGTAYVVGDKVTYDGKDYECVQNGTGQQPDTSPLYWEEIFRLTYKCIQDGTGQQPDISPLYWTEVDVQDFWVPLENIGMI